jgi:uncharacterized membrane protein
MDDRLAKLKGDIAALVKKIQLRNPIIAVVAVVAIAFLISGVWVYLLIAGLHDKMELLEATAKSSEDRIAVLAEQVRGQERELSDLAKALEVARSGSVSDIEKQFVQSASARMEATVAREISALGTSGFRFHVVEFDKRACANGGVFSGEHPDGYQQDEPFNANNMVEILESYGDVRGIPFYRVKINGATLQWQGNPATFRHGSMRIECN